MELMPEYKQTEVGRIPADWNAIPLGHLTASVEYGSSAKSHPTGRTPVLRMGNLQGGKIDWANLVYTDDPSEIAKYTLHSGDVLFNRTNTIDLVGKAALFKGEHPAIFAGYLIRIKTNKHLLDARFLNYVLNAEFSRSVSE
jgi:type I restriction enzyme S subunit